MRYSCGCPRPVTSNRDTCEIHGAPLMVTTTVTNVTRQKLKQLSLGAFMAGFYHGAEHMKPEMRQWEDGQLEIFEATGMEIFERQYSKILETLRESGIL